MVGDREGHLAEVVEELDPTVGNDWGMIDIGTDFSGGFFKCWGRSA